MRTKVIDQRRRAGYFPYYKLQVLAPHVGAWKDVQRRFEMAEAVLEHGPKLPSSSARSANAINTSRGAGGMSVRFIAHVRYPRLMPVPRRGLSPGGAAQSSPH